MSCEAKKKDPSSGEEIDDTEIVHFPETKPADWERYNKQVEESDGFDVDFFPGEERIPGCIAPISVEGEGDHSFYAELLRPAIEQHNQQQKDAGETLIEFERIIKLTGQFYPGVCLYYTFEAKDVRGGTKRTFQAQVAAIHLIEDYSPLIFREKASSEHGVNLKHSDSPLTGMDPASLGRNDI